MTAVGNWIYNFLKNQWPVLGLVGLVVAAHAYQFGSGEPYFNGDESRHLMSGVFFRDLFVDFPFTRLYDYAKDYYIQYPALNLIIYPPLAYALQGLAFVVFGISFGVGKLVIATLGVVAVIYLYRLTCRTHDRLVAIVAAGLFAFTPQFFVLARHIMLEVPTLAFALAACYHFLRYLEHERARDVVIASVCAAFAALCRYDAVYLLLVFALWLLLERKFYLIGRREVLLSTALGIALVAPVYGFTFFELDSSRFYIESYRGANESQSVFLRWDSLLFYVQALPQILGWPTLVLTSVGILAALVRREQRNLMIYGILAATPILMFSVVGKTEFRDAVYLCAPLATFAASGLFIVASYLPRTQVVAWLSVMLIVSMNFWQGAHKDSGHIQGYAEAAQYVLDNTTKSNACLFDGILNGDFVYQMRRLDPERRLWVLRGDKIFYNTLVLPKYEYESYAGNESDVLALIDQYGPELILVEKSISKFLDTEGARLLRKVLADRSDRFQLTARFPVSSTVSHLQPGEILVYRNLTPHPLPPAIQIRTLRMKSPLNSSSSSQ